MEFMARFAEGSILIQYVIVLIIFVEKVIILKICQKLGYFFFTNYHDCIWINEINQFNLD
jgi:hypothetical protein